MVSRVIMFFSVLLIQLSSFEARIHPLHPKTSGEIGTDRRAFGRILGGIDQQTLGGIEITNFGISNGFSDRRAFGRILGGIDQQTIGRTLGGIDRRNFGSSNGVNEQRSDRRAFGRIFGGIDLRPLGRPLNGIDLTTLHPQTAIDLENPASTCSCNGAIDEKYSGECTKESVWCYVDPSAPCEDSEVWYGGFGHGWSYSHKACEAHLAEVHKDECQALIENQEALNTTETEDKECSCNGELDSIDMGECGTPWIGRFWCYVDSLGSGCKDAQVWYGEYGFCHTYSFMACQGYDNADGW